MVLLAIPGHPLQARYSMYQGTYVVERKVNDVDYALIVRSNNMQLWHINMLKEYHELKNGEEPCAVVIATTVDLDQRKLDIEKEGQNSEYIDEV